MDFYDGVAVGIGLMMAMNVIGNLLLWKLLNPASADNES